VIALGYDQRDILEAVNDVLQEYTGEVKVVQTKRYGMRDLNSSSKIKNKIIEELKF
jgi:glycerol-3-phosphate cytidylyltransferase-like family protein